MTQIRASLNPEASKTIAAAIVGPRLDFCISLPACTSDSNLTRLQLVQNSLARVVAQKPRFCHITPVLFDLHWLPVCHRICFKIAAVAFRVLQFQQPSCISHPMICTDASTPLLLINLCQYVFPHVKPPWQPPNHFHLLLRVSGMHCQNICRPSQLFWLLEELSNIIYSCLLTLTVVQNLVRSNQLNDFVIQYHATTATALLGNAMPPIYSCKGVPSERLRLVKRFIPHRLHTGPWVNLVLYLLILEQYIFYANYKNIKTSKFYFLFLFIDVSPLRSSKGLLKPLLTYLLIKSNKITERKT